MEISVIASGSNGNSCLVEHKSTSILIDAGKSCREIEARMEKMGKFLENVDALIITHAHSDHVRGVGAISRKHNIPVYLTKETFSRARHLLGEFERKTFKHNNSFMIINTLIRPIKTSHSVDSCGFVMGKFGLFTDTGIVTKEIQVAALKLDTILLESNYDIDMLLNGSYPVYLKQQVLSNHGHLSNIHASHLVEKTKNLQTVLLGHLSGNNNTKSLAEKTFETLVKRKMDFQVCSREKESGTWEV